MNSSMENLINYISGNIDSWTGLGYIPKEGWRMFGEHKIIGISQDATHGVSQFSEVIAQLCVLKNPGMISAYAINEIAFRLLARFGNQLDPKILEAISSGAKNIALCITEEKAGSDLGAIETEGISAGDVYTLAGHKILISNGPIADYFIVAVKTNKQVEAWRGITLFLLNREDPGLVISPPVAKAGVAVMPIGEISLNGFKVSENRILGKKNRGFEYLMNILNFERTVISIMATSMCEDLLKEVVGYLGERQIFDKKLRDYQNTKFVMAGLFSRTKALRTFVNSIIAEFDQEVIDKTNIIIAKILATELLKDTVTSLSQLYGSRGYLSNHWIANYYNDIRWTAVAGGANELLLDVLGNNLVHGGS